MSRLDFKTKDRAQVVVEGLYQDLERRIIASPPGQCPVDMAESFLKLCHAQSCGKCVPCRVGIGQLLKILDDILDLNKEKSMEQLELLRRTAVVIKESADCAIGTEAASMVLRGLDGFREDYEEHIRHNRCATSIQEGKQPGTVRGTLSCRRRCAWIHSSGNGRQIRRCCKTDQKGQSVPDSLCTYLRTSLRGKVPEDS